MPIQWATGRIGINNDDIMEPLLAHMEIAQCANKQRPFLLPDFVPRGADFNTARGFSDSAMDPSKIRRQISLALRAAGVSQEVIDLIEGLYSFRRILPTLAHRASFNVSERIDVGAWISKEEKTEAAMPQLYSEAKLTMQSLRKSELVYLANQCFAKIISNPETSINFTWELAFAHWPDRPKNFTHVSALQDSSAKLGKKTLQSDSDSGSLHDSSDSSDSSSENMSDMFGSESDNDREAEGELYPSFLNDVSWQLAAGPKGKLHLCEGDSLCCGRTLRLPESGTSLASAYETKRDWSPRCWQKLPPKAQLWWNEIE